MTPIDMILHCPQCRHQHVDNPEPERVVARGYTASDGLKRIPAWDNPPHRSHLCRACGCIWRPADVPTNGVAAIATRGEKDTWP